MDKGQELTFQVVVDALLSCKWIYAKTMPYAPHWYTLKKDWHQKISFDAVVLYIRKHGYKEKYGKSWYIKLNIRDMQYWTMGSPLPQTILINRAFNKIQAI